MKYANGINYNTSMNKTAGNNANCPGVPNCNPMNAEKEHLLMDIHTVGFLLVDMALYLDTHPYDRDALDFYNHYLRIQKGLKQEFANKYYPLTLDTADGCGKEWKWGFAPAPWEGVC